MAIPKKLKITLGVFGVLLLSLLIIPFFININHYKPTIIQQIEQHIDRPVKIEGDLSLSLIPQPKVSVENITILDKPGAQYPEIVHLESASVALKWLPLLRKRIDVSSVRLIKPTIHLKKDSDGKSNWDFITQAQAEQPTNPPVTAQESKAQSSGDLDIALSQVVIRDGHLTYNNAGKEIKVEHINLQLKADSLKGPFEVQGSVTLLDKELKLNTQVGNLESDKGTTLESELSYDDHILKLEGLLNMKEESFAGKVSGKVSAKEIEVLPHDMEVEATLAASSKELYARDIKISSDKEKCNGELRMDLESQTVKLALTGLSSQLDLKLDAALPDQKAHINAALTHPKNLLKWLKIDHKDMPEVLLTQPIHLKADGTWTDKEQTLRNIHLITGKGELTGHVSWQDPTINFDLESPSSAIWLQLGGMDIQGSGGKLAVKGKATYKDKQLAFNVQGQTLETQIKAQGTFQQDSQAFDVHATVSNPNANQLLAALKNSQPTLKLGPASVEAHVKGTPKDIHLQKLDLQLNPGDALPIRTQGRIQLNKVKKLTLNVSVGHVRLDQLILESTPTSTTIGSSGDHGTPQEKWSKDPIDLSFLEDLEATIHLTVHRISNPKLDIRSLVLPIRIGQGKLDTDLSGQFFAGGMKGGLHIDRHKNNAMDIDLTIKQANMQSFLNSYQIAQIKGGTMDIDAHARGSGKSLYDLMHSLGGHVKLNAAGGQLKGGLFNFAKGLDLSKLFQLGKLGKVSQEELVSLVIEAPIQTGIMTVKKGDLKTPLGNGKTQGYINLGAWTLDTTTTIDPSELGVNGDIIVKAYGSLDHPQTKFKTPTISPDILTKGVGNTLKNTVSTFIPGSEALLDQIPGLGTGSKHKKTDQNSGKKKKGKKQSLKLNDLLNRL